jgi:histidinol-phosphate aminotransferase
MGEEKQAVVPGFGDRDGKLCAVDFACVDLDGLAWGVVTKGSGEGDRESQAKRRKRTRDRRLEHVTAILAFVSRQGESLLAFAEGRFRIKYPVPVTVNPTALAKPLVLNFPTYVPGKPIEDVARSMGIDPSGIIKLASNENPFGPSPLAVAAAKHALEQGQYYPDGGCFALRNRLAAFHGLLPDQFVIGNGSNELIELLGHVFLNPGDEVVMGRPEFVVYKLVALLFDAKPVEVPLLKFRNDLDGLARAVTPKTKLVIVSSPNNPTGSANTEAELLGFIRSLPDSVICVVDEAYTDFDEGAPDIRPLIAEGRNVIGLRTFSKAYGLASLRIGYGYAGAELTSLLDRIRQPFNVNAIGQAAAIAALDDQEFRAMSVKGTREGLRRLEAGFAALGLEYVPSKANFVLVKVGDGASVFETLQRRGVIIRPLKSYDLPEWIRVTSGTPEQNERFLVELAAAVC